MKHLETLKEKQEALIKKQKELLNDMEKQIVTQGQDYKEKQYKQAKMKLKNIPHIKEVLSQDEIKAFEKYRKQIKKKLANQK